MFPQMPHLYPLLLHSTPSSSACRMKLQYFSSTSSGWHLSTVHCLRYLCPLSGCIVANFWLVASSVAKSLEKGFNSPALLSSTLICRMCEVLDLVGMVDIVIYCHQSKLQKLWDATVLGLVDEVNFKFTLIHFESLWSKSLSLMRSLKPNLRHFGPLWITLNLFQSLWFTYETAQRQQRDTPQRHPWYTLGTCLENMHCNTWW